MKKLSPGASVHRDYYYVCDNCEIDDGRPVLTWGKLPQRSGHFCMCFECLNRLYCEYFNKGEPIVMVSRMVISEKLRNEIFLRDKNQCVLCGGTTNLQIDHILPFSRGGQTTKENLQTLCRSCNLKKGNKHG